MCNTECNCNSYIIGPTLITIKSIHSVSQRLKHYLLSLLSKYGPEENRTPDLIIANDAF